MYTIRDEPSARDLTHCLDSVANRETISLTGSSCSSEQTDGNRGLAPGAYQRCAYGRGAWPAFPDSAAGGVDSCTLRLAAPKELNGLARPAAAHGPRCPAATQHGRPSRVSGLDATRKQGVPGSAPRPEVTPGTSDLSLAGAARAYPCALSDASFPREAYHHRCEARPRRRGAGEGDGARPPAGLGPRLTAAAPLGAPGRARREGSRRGEDSREVRGRGEVHVPAPADSSALSKA